VEAPIGVRACQAKPRERAPYVWGTRNGGNSITDLDHGRGSRNPCAGFSRDHLRRRAQRTSAICHRRRPTIPEISSGVDRRVAPRGEHADRDTRATASGQVKPKTPYGTTGSTWWDSDVGWQLQTAGWEPLVLLLYLTSNRHANMLGLYRLPVDQVGRELKVIPRPALLPAFDVLARLQAAFYDHDTEFVWVREMAGQRVNPAAAVESERTLLTNDNRWIAVQRAYGELPANLFLGAFFDHYQSRLRLVCRRPGSGAEEWNIPRSMKGLPKPFPSPLATTVEQEQGDQRSDRADEQVPDDQTNRRVEIADPVEDAGQLPLPVPRMQLVPDAVKEIADDVTESIADLVLKQVRLMQPWQSRDDLIDWTHELCSKTPGLTRVRRRVVTAGVDRALREAHERGLSFPSAPGVRLMDVRHGNRDAG